MNFKFSVKFSVMTKLITLLCLILTVAHYCACGFLLIVRIEGEDVDTWVTSAEI